MSFLTKNIKNSSPHPGRAAHPATAAPPPPVTPPRGVLGGVGLGNRRRRPTEVVCTATAMSACGDGQGGSSAGARG